MADQTETVLTEQRGKVLVITLNRPEARNAVSPEQADALHAAFLDFNWSQAISANSRPGSGPA